MIMCHLKTNLSKAFLKFIFQQIRSKVLLQNIAKFCVLFIPSIIWTDGSKNKVNPTISICPLFLPIFINRYHNYEIFMKFCHTYLRHYFVKKDFEDIENYLNFLSHRKRNKKCLILNLRVLHNVKLRFCLLCV